MFKYLAMKKILSLILVLTISCSIYAQQQSGNKPSCDVNLKSYYKFVKSDANNYYYQIDLTKFSTQFEKSFFMNQVYKNNVLVSIDSDLSKNKIQIMSNIAHTEQKIIENIEDVIYKTVSANSSYSPQDKQNWMTSNTK